MNITTPDTTAQGRVSAVAEDGDDRLAAAFEGPRSRHVTTHPAGTSSRRRCASGTPVPLSLVDVSLPAGTCGGWKLRRHRRSTCWNVPEGGRSGERNGPGTGPFAS